MFWWLKIGILLGFCSEVQVCFFGESVEWVIQEFGEFCVWYDIDVYFQQKGWLWIVIMVYYFDVWNDIFVVCEWFGVSFFECFDVSEVVCWIGLLVYFVGVFECSNVIV